MIYTKREPVSQRALSVWVARASTCSFVSSWVAASGDWLPICRRRGIRRGQGRLEHVGPHVVINFIEILELIFYVLCRHFLNCCQVFCSPWDGIGWHWSQCCIRESRISRIEYRQNNTLVCHTPLTLSRLPATCRQQCYNSLQLSSKHRVARQAWTCLTLELHLKHSERDIGKREREREMVRTDVLG